MASNFTQLKPRSSFTWRFSQIAGRETHYRVIFKKSLRFQEKPCVEDPNVGIDFDELIDAYKLSCCAEYDNLNFYIVHDEDILVEYTYNIEFSVTDWNNSTLENVIYVLNIVLVEKVSLADVKCVEPIYSYWSV